MPDTFELMVPAMLPEGMARERFCGSTPANLQIFPDHSFLTTSKSIVRAAKE